MNYISNIFSRLTPQQICEFLLHGIECDEISDKTYQQRLDDAQKTMTGFLLEKFPDTDDYDEAISKIYDYVGVSESVHMEIGMQCAAALAVPLQNGSPRTHGKSVT